MNDPDHPILDKPCRWEIKGFEWRSRDGSDTCSLDVTFIRAGCQRRLRFVDPQDVKIEFSGSNPIQCVEMANLDVSSRQLEGIGVQVTDCGASGTPLRLYAKSVLEIVDQ